MNKTLILVVEDDTPVHNLITTTLKTHDYKYISAKNGAGAIMEASTHNPDIVLLDLGLPDIDGVEVIEKIRSWSNMPIIVISARSEDSDKIEALDAGADDYLTKPFSVEELLARLRVTQRRLSQMQAENGVQSAVFENGALRIEYAAGCAYLDGEELHLTPIEYKLLCLLSQNAGKVLTHTFIRKQGKNLIETKRDEFVKQNLLSDEFIQMMQKNKKPFELLMSYYQCAIMEIETKFRVLNQEYSLSYDQNPIEGIKTRVKSYESIMRKIRVKDIPVTLESIEENIRDIAGVRVICSFPSDIYKLADSFLKQDDITLIERKDYIQHPKESGYRSLHLIVQVPIFLQDTKKLVYVEVQFRTIAMDFWASLEHKMRYKKNIPENHVKYLQDELYDCARQSAELDNRMQNIRNLIAEEAEEEDHCTFVTLPMR